MGIWIFKSAKEKALTKMAKAVESMERLAYAEYEDEELGLLARRIKHLERLFTPEAAPAAGIDQLLPPGTLDAWYAIPDRYKAMANMAARAVTGVSIDEAISDPNKLKLLLEKAGPYLPKAWKAQPPPATAAPNPYLQPYDPRQSDDRVAET